MSPLSITQVQPYPALYPSFVLVSTLYQATKTDETITLLVITSSLETITISKGESMKCLPNLENLNPEQGLQGKAPFTTPPLLSLNEPL